VSNTLPNPIGYFHGRFQPFHLGHLAMVRKVLDKCALVAIGISNPFRLQPVVASEFSELESSSLRVARAPENNPWPFWARVLMIREGLQSEGIDLARVLFIPNLRNSGIPVDEVAFPKALTIVYICTKSAHNKAAAREYKGQGWTVIEVPPPRDSMGSSTIRRKMQLGEPWEHLLPAGTSAVIKELSESFPVLFGTR
jgi:nicotinamide-nucleotide adenylyltransferase